MVGMGTPSAADSGMTPRGKENVMVFVAKNSNLRLNL